MVTTKAQMAEKKRQGFYVKEDNPARKHMSQKDAIEDNRRLKEDREKVAALTQKLKDDRKEKPKETPKVDIEKLEAEKKEKIEAENKKITIDGLEAQLENLKGPGSKARKDELREKINALKGDGRHNEKLR